MKNKAAAMRRQVQGALKSAISDHGVITKPLIGSVLKRLENQPEYKRLLENDGSETQTLDDAPKGA